MNRFRIPAFILLFAMICLAEVVAKDSLIDANQIMEKQKEYHEAETEFFEQAMMLIDEQGNKQKRSVRFYLKKQDDDLRRLLIVFLAPPEIEGTALLTWEQRGRDNDQWVFMPATKKMQRIARSSQRSYFMGTDWTYEDLMPEQLNDFRYSVQRIDTLKVDDAERPCWVIEAVPGNADKMKKSGYSKRLLWVDKQRFLSLKIEYYDRRNRLVKIQSFSSLKGFERHLWRAGKIHIDNISKNHQTLGLQTEHRVNEPISDFVFSERFILSGRHTE